MSKFSRERNQETLAQFGAGVLILLLGIGAVVGVVVLAGWLFFRGLPF